MSDKPPGRHRQLGILNRFFGVSSLKITIESQTFEFETTDEFKKFLAARTEIPASKMQKMLEKADRYLVEEAKQLAEAEHKINERLAATVRDPGSIDRYLNDATMVRFTQDYDWRQIMFELSKHSTDFSEFKLEAVAAYLAYLQSRINIVNGIIKDRDSRARMQAPDKESLDTIETVVTGASVDYSDTADIEESIRAQTMKTSHVDEHAIPAEFTRIPRGQTVIVDVGKISRLPVKIASHAFIVDNSGSEPLLISRKGDRYSLKSGENLIGRSSKCSIVLDSRFDDISRQHLIIEYYPDKTLHFTDLSSSGTQLRKNVYKIKPE